jgi:uncharacterized protein YjbJ (UPF0337 family)
MNTTNAEGVFDQAKGKVKEALGETFHNEKLADAGVADQVKGHAEEAWGNVKDTAGQIAGQHAGEAHAHADHARSSIADAAESAKESINRGLDHLKGKA